MDLPKTSVSRSLLCALATGCLGIGAAQAVINPALQPDVYYQSYDNVVVLEIVAIDEAAAELQCKVIKAIKGGYKPDEQVKVAFTGSLSPQVAERVADGSFAVGDQFPAFAGKPSRRKSNRQVRMYDDMFYVGEVKEAGLWNIGISDDVEVDPEGNAVNTLAGIFCGMTGELVRMLEDMSEDRDYYPRKAYIKFKPDVLVDELAKPVEGVAMYDLNGDGMEDLVACSPAGDRIYLQIEPMKFTDMTEKLGVDSASISCSVADVDCDGLNDLMLGTKIYQGVFADNTFKFVPVDWLEVGDASGFKSASFVELDGDGYPDVIVSQEGKGLRSFANPGKKKGNFTESTQATGLDQAACGAGGNGYFTPGDWNGDLRTDLFFAHGDGFLMVQDESGKFTPVEQDVEFSFKTGLDEYGKTGAGVFMPTFRPDKPDLIVPIEKDWLIVSNLDGTPTDITVWGNEISEGSDYHLATVAADLNVDGYTDLYTVCDQQKENRCILNRGYGSYMHAKVHVDEKPLFRGPAHAAGGKSVAAGDVNNDGAPDILIGNEQGQLFLIVNDTLSMRQETELKKKDETRLLDVRLCSVRVLGPRGVVNARLRLLDSSGKVVIRQDLGGNVATGCSSPNAACLAVRKPGKYQLTVEYSDGYKRELEVDLTTGKHASLVVQRNDDDDDAEW